MAEASEVTVTDAEVSWFDKRYEELRAQYPENVIECQRRTMQEWLADRVPDKQLLEASMKMEISQYWCGFNDCRAAVLRGPG